MQGEREIEIGLLRRENTVEVKLSACVCGGGGEGGVVDAVRRKIPWNGAVEAGA